MAENLSEKEEQRFCRICDRLFATKFTFQRHWKVRHLLGKVPCDLCDGVVLFNPNSIVQHKRKQHGINIPKIKRGTKKHCELCDRTFRNYSRYLLHYERIHERKLVKCSVKKCNLKFHASQIRLHEWQAHRINGTRFCQLCEEDVPYTEQEMHNRDHKDGPNRTCTICHVEIKEERYNYHMSVRHND